MIDITPTTIDEIKSLNAASHGHYFDRDAMRFFRSRVSSRVHVGASMKRVYFVTSEQFDDGYARLFSVRVFHVCNSRIDTVGEFQAYATSAQAHRAAARIAREDTDTTD